MLLFKLSDLSQLTGGGKAGGKKYLSDDLWMAPVGAGLARDGSAGQSIFAIGLNPNSLDLIEEAPVVSAVIQAGGAWGLVVCRLPDDLQLCHKSNFWHARGLFRFITPLLLLMGFEGWGESSRLGDFQVPSRSGQFITNCIENTLSQTHFEAGSHFTPHLQRLPSGVKQQVRSTGWSSSSL